MRLDIPKPKDMYIKEVRKTGGNKIQEMIADFR